VKFVAPATALASALFLAGAALRTNRRIAAPEAVRLVAADGAVAVACTGTAIMISASIKADVIEPGQIAVAADRLAGLAAGFPPTARLTISAGAGFVTITCGNSRSRLPLIPLDDLPDALALDTETGRVEISGSDLLTLLEPLPAADSATTRYYLHGVHWRSDAGKLIATSTNGSRLIRTAVKGDRFTEGGLILPSESAASLVRIVKATKPDKVTLRASERLLAVEGDAFSFTFTSQLIDYRYPDTSRVIPPPSANCAICKPADLLAAIQRLAAVATTDPPPMIALAFDAAQPSLHVFLVRQPDDGSDAVPAETTGNARVIVSPSLLAGMLAQFVSGRVRLDVGDGQRPVLIHGDDGKLGMLMPCSFNFSNSNAREAAAT
jgi:DNA polymerase-3 subunit beta